MLFLPNYALYPSAACRAELYGPSNAAGRTVRARLIVRMNGVLARGQNTAGRSVVKEG